MKKLVNRTNFGEIEIKGLMRLFVKHAKRGRGLSFISFDSFWAELSSVTHHPYLIDLFMFFDRETVDSALDFYELVLGINLVQNSTIEQ